MQGDFFLTQWVFYGMRWLYENLTGESIVLTVVISTIVIRMLTIFGDIKSRESSMKMQAIQPQMQKIQKKYEKDPQRMQLETNKLMKDNGVSMFGGCLPMLITMPLFFVFIAAFRQWGQEMMVKVMVLLEEDQPAAIEMFQRFKFLWVNNMWQPDNGFQPVVQTAERLFSSAEKINQLLYFAEHPEARDLFIKLGFFVEDATNHYGCTIAPITEELKTAYNNLVQPLTDLYKGYNNGWFVFPVVCCATTFLSSWIMQKSQPGSNNANDAANSTAKTMTYLMPAMTFFFCLSTNACFALYWTVSNVISTISSLILNKMFAARMKPAEAEGVVEK